MNSSTNFDVVVAGAGPAGCAAALALRRQASSARILLLEPGSYPRHKVCGEFVSAEGISALQSLFTPTDLPPLLYPAPRIAQSRIFVDGSCFSARIQPPACSIPRYQLDAFLWQACRSRDIECRQGSALQIEGTHQLSVSTATETIKTSAVVNAAGRWSRLSASIAGDQPPVKWIGLKAHFTEPHPHDSVDLYFFAGGYCGVQPVDVRTINVCAMVRADAATELSAVFALHAALAARSRSWQQASESVSTAPLVFQRPRPVDKNVLNVGDAAGFIDPFVGDGITLALLSGSLAGECLADWLQNGTSRDEALANYQRRYRQQLSPLFRRAAHVRELINLPRPLRSLALKALRVPSLANFIVRQTRPSRLSA